MIPDQLHFLWYGRALPWFAALAIESELEQRVARQLRHEVASEPADCAEARCSRARRAGPALVVVAVADHADPIALVECVVQ